MVDKHNCFEDTKEPIFGQNLWSQAHKSKPVTTHALDEEVNRTKQFKQGLFIRYPFSVDCLRTQASFYLCALKEIKLLSVDFGYKQYLQSNLSKSFLVQLWKIPQGQQLSDAELLKCCKMPLKIQKQPAYGQNIRAEMGREEDPSKRTIIFFLIFCRKYFLFYKKAE